MTFTFKEGDYVRFKLGLPPYSIGIVKSVNVSVDRVYVWWKRSATWHGAEVLCPVPPLVLLAMQAPE